MGIIAAWHPRLLRLQRERSPNPARLSSSGRDDPTSKYLHKSRCRPHAAPAIRLANLGPGISPRGGSRTREGGAGAGRRRGAYPGPVGTLPTGLGHQARPGVTAEPGQDRGVGSSVSHGPAGPSSSWEPRIFWRLVLGSPLPRRKGIPSPPSSGKSPTSPGQQLFSFLSLPLPPPPPFWTEFLVDSTTLANGGFYRKSLHSPRRRGVMGLGQS